MVHNKFWDTQLIKIKQTIVSTTVRQQEPPDRGTLSNHREAGSFCTGSGGSFLDKLHLDLNLRIKSNTLLILISYMVVHIS